MPELFAWIQRVMDGNHFSYEVIFVNDGSTDNSFQILKEYQALPPDQMITSSVMDMRVPGGRGKRKRDGANQQIGMYQKETPAQRILQLQEALNKIHGRILSAAAQMQKNEMDKLHLETEQQRLELLRIRATGEIGEPGDGDKDAVHE